MKKFIFDVDGTLTPSRKQMDIGFSSEFLIFCCKYDTYFVTGSDKAKTVEQVGSDRGPVGSVGRIQTRALTGLYNQSIRYFLG